MSEEATVPEARLDLEAADFHDLTLAFDAFHRRPGADDGVARLAGRRFLRCNLAGPALVSLGPGVSFADCVFSACAFTLVADGMPAPGSVMLEDCRLDDCG